jgi:hypothetical protein
MFDDIDKKVKTSVEADIPGEIETKSEEGSPAETEVQVEPAETDSTLAETKAQIDPRENEAQSEVKAQEVVEANTDTDEAAAIPPVVEIRSLLTDFEMRVPVWGLTVFTVDGYILAHKLFYEAMPNDIEMVVSSMSAGLITISEDFIRMVNASSTFKQVLVDAESSDNQNAFSIILRHVSDNVMLAIENLSKDIVDVVSNWEVKLHEETVT